MQEWLKIIRQLLIDERNGLVESQRQQLLALNNYVIADLIRIEQTTFTLRDFNARTKALRSEMLKRLNEILEQENDAIAAVLLAVFPIVFGGHITALLAGTALSIVIPTTEQLQTDYRADALGHHYKRALNRLRRLYLKRYDQDITKLKRRFIVDSEDVYDILKLRDKVHREMMDRFHIINDQELHRVYESAKYESAKYLRENGVMTTKTWQTRKDNKVRNNREVASHVAMQGVTIESDKKFDLVPNGQTHYPTGSGIAAQDCNCRCEAQYKII